MCHIGYISSIHCRRSSQRDIIHKHTSHVYAFSGIKFCRNSFQFRSISKHTNHCNTLRSIRHISNKLNSICSSRIILNQPISEISHQFLRLINTSNLPAFINSGNYISIIFIISESISTTIEYQSTISFSRTTNSFKQFKDISFRDCSIFKVKSTMNRICFEMNFSEFRATLKHTICMYYIAHIQFTRNSSKFITAIIHMISKLSRRNIDLRSNTNSLIYIR